MPRFWLNKTWWRWFLLPLAFVFYLLSRARYFLYRCGVFKVHQLDVPVVVVGNISVGGNGKTPLVLFLAQALVAHGFKVGILSRGYGGSCRQFPHQVSVSQDSASKVGDEPYLMALRNIAPVVIDPKRARGAEYLAKHLQCELIISDDGLQHYALARDYEIVVMDERGVGNGALLPMGPLRELPSRLKQVNALVINGNKTPSVDTSALLTHMQLEAADLRPLNENEQLFDPDIRPITAIAGIGYPQRFFNTLSSLNISPDQQRAMPDHHQFSIDDFPTDGTILMTEKDAVKCRQLALKNAWYLPVNANLDQRLLDDILKVLGNLTKHTTT